jgi:hypothetical protein
MVPLLRVKGGRGIVFAFQDVTYSDIDRPTTSQSEKKHAIKHFFFRAEEEMKMDGYILHATVSIYSGVLTGSEEKKRV